MSILSYRRRTFAWMTMIAGGVITACGMPIPAPNMAPGTVSQGPPVGFKSNLVFGKDLTGNVATLTLAPYADGRNQRPAADIPTTKVTVRLPLYPNATSTNQPYPNADVDYPGSPYLVTAKQEYVLPAGVPTAEGWYKRNLEAAGYTYNGSGSVADNKTGEHSEGLRFIPDSNAGLQVELSFEQTNDGKTLLEYWITDILQPPRSPDTIISGDVTRINVTYTPNSMNSNQSITKTITDPLTIASWVAEFNSLQGDTRGFHGSVLNNGHADLVFVRKDGNTLLAHIDPSSFSVTLHGGPGFMMGHLWDKVTAVMDPQAR